MPTKKVLIVLSDAHSFPIAKQPDSGRPDGPKEVEQPTGFFLMEVAKPLEQLLKAGYDVTFASPTGEKPAPDPNSDNLIAFGGNYHERQRERNLITRMRSEKRFDSPRTFKSITEKELESFTGIFIPGGHAPLRDLGNDPDLGRILKHFHAHAKPTAAIFHGLYAFLSTRETEDGFLYQGYRLTSFSDAEEKMVESILGGEINPLVESSLRKAGAVMVEGTRKKMGGITVDKEVVSGGNPLAAQELGCQFVTMLSAAA